MVKLHQIGIVTMGLLLASFGRAEAQQGLSNAQIVGLFEVPFSAQLTGTAIGIPVPGFPNPPTIEIIGTFDFVKSPPQLDLVSATINHFLDVTGQYFHSHDGTFRLVAADGATLIGSFVGRIRPPIPADPLGRGHFYWLITNGTGRFAGAIGSGDFTSERAIGDGGSEAAVVRWKGVVAIPARP
jgi:hypothetical protein